MWWKLKAAIHQGISLLPDQLSHSANFFFQRRFGRLTGIDTSLEHLLVGRRYADTFVQTGRSLEGCTVLEIGTGRHLDLSIALWLCGAEKVITADVHPYLQPDIILAKLAFLKAHAESLRSLFGPFAATSLFQERYGRLLDVPLSLQSLLDLTGISYRTMADTAHLDLPDASVDYYISYSVVQYIPPAQLEGVFREGIRVLRKGGLHYHAIDLSDWFATSDPTISKINFLRFSEREWRRIAGNRYMYQNRMRIDDYTPLLARLGYTIHQCEVIRDEKAVELLKAGFHLDSQFSGKSIETNATVGAWVLASPTAAP
jgi:hypothetical protein